MNSTSSSRPSLLSGLIWFALGSLTLMVVSRITFGGAPSTADALRKPEPAQRESGTPDLPEIQTREHGPRSD